MRKYLIEAVVLVVVDQTIRLLKPNYLPLAWFGILVVITSEIIWAKRHRIGSISAGWGKRKIMGSYVLVGLAGALWLMVYWFASQKAFKALASTPQNTTSEPATKANKPEVTPTAAPPPVAKQHPLAKKHKHPIEAATTITPPPSESPAPATPSGNSESTTIQQSNSGGINVQQATTGADSPIVNSPVTINQEPLVWYDFNGARHRRSGNRFEAVAVQEMTSFQEMGRMEKVQDWVGLKDYAEQQIAKYPTWWSPFLIAGEAYIHLGDRSKAIERTEEGIRLAQGTPSQDDPAYQMGVSNLQKFRAMQPQ